MTVGATIKAYTQGDCISKQGQVPGEVGFVQLARLNLPRSDLFAALLHDVDGHVAENGDIVGTVSQMAAVLILVHDDIEPPVQAMFDAPMRADDFVEAFGRQRRAEQIIGGLDVVLPAVSRRRSTLPTAARPGQ